MNIARGFNHGDTDYGLWIMDFEMDFEMDCENVL